MTGEISSDQEFLQETTVKFLENEVPVGGLRALRDDPRGFDSEYWRKGAELGWTSLLVDEDRGGGSVSGNGLIDLTLIAHEFGRHGSPGPLVGANIVAAALGSAPDDRRADVLNGLLAGTAVATWCLEEGGSLDRIEMEVRPQGGDLLLNGSKRPVEAAGQADHLLVTGRTGDGLTQVLVPADSPGLSIRPLKSVDLTRRFARVDFDDVRVPSDAVVGEIGKADFEVNRLVQLALVLLSSESVGAMERGFEITVEWAFDRYSFGRPLASYQAIKHRFAEMKSWLEAGHAMADAAATAVGSRSDDAEEIASAAKAFVGQYGGELLQDCVQIHGGIGVTFDHDLHIFLRRLTADRMLFGTPAEHRRRIAAILEQREERA